MEKLLEDNGRAGPCETCEHRQSETLDTQQAGMQCESGLSLCVRHRTWLVRALEHDCTGARWAETPSILGDDGPVRCVPFLPVLRHVGRSLFCGLVSQGCTGHDRACNAAALSELSAHSHRSVTGDKAVARITPAARGGATCKRPKELGLLGLLRLRKVIELRTARNTQ